MRRVSAIWLGAVVLVACLALWAVQGFGFSGEIAMWREIAVRGRDLTHQVAQPIAEMTQQLTAVGCNRFALAYWSVSIPTRLYVEVRCREWASDVPRDSDSPAARTSHESTVSDTSRWGIEH